MIEFRGVTRHYGTKVAVDGLDLTIPRGESFALLGPNGAGKTTSIKLLVGLLRPTAGTVSVAGHDLVGDPRGAHLHLGYVPDEPTLYEKLTGYEFLRFIADMFGMPRDRAGAASGRRSKPSSWPDSPTTSPRATRWGCGSGSCSPRRCSTTRTSWSSTSRWWGSIRAASASSRISSAGARRRG